MRGAGNTGVLGNGSAFGVDGFGDIGVHGATGRSPGGIGIKGEVGDPGPTFAAVGCVAVQGLNKCTGANNIGVQGQCDVATGTGVQGTSAGGLGVSCQGGLAPIRLVPGTLAATALTATGHQAGELYVTSDNHLMFFDGTAWKQVFLGVPPTSAPPPSGPPPPVTGSPNPAPPGRSSVGSGPSKQAATPEPVVPPAPSSRP